MMGNKGSTTFQSVLLIVVVLGAIGFYFWSSNGSMITGLATLDFDEVVIELDDQIDTTSSLPLVVATPAFKGTVTGTMSGTGLVVIRVLEGTQSFVLYEKELTGGEVSFNSCGELCSYDLKKENVVLDIEIDGRVQVTIDSFSYLTDTTNSPPQLVGSSPAFRLAKNKGINVDLSRFIVDTDGDSLTFVALGDEHFSVELFGSELHISPEFGYTGEGIVEVYASDYDSTTKIDVAVIAGSAQDLLPQPDYYDTVCGNGVCQRYEDSRSCPQDCGVAPLGVENKNKPATAILFFGTGFVLLLLGFILRHFFDHEEKLRKNNPKRKKKVVVKRQSRSSASKRRKAVVGKRKTNSKKKSTKRKSKKKR